MADALKGTKLPADMNGSSVPRTETLPKPVTTNPDLSQIAEGYRQFPATNVARPADLPELMVFVSFSMPKESLERIVLQSEMTGAVLVLRGLKGNSLTRMGEEVAQLVGKRNVTAIIPGMFTTAHARRKRRERPSTPAQCASPSFPTTRCAC